MLPDRHALLPLPATGHLLPDAGMTVRTETPVLCIACADDERPWVHVGSFEGWPLMVRIIWRVLRWH